MTSADLMLWLGNLALSLASVAGAWVIKWLSSKTHNDTANALIGRIGELAGLVVRDVYQAYVEPLKRSGKWDRFAQEEAKARAVAALRSYLGPKGIAELVKLVGDAGTVTSLLQAAVEKAVANDKVEDSLIIAPHPAEAVG